MFLGRDWISRASADFARDLQLVHLHFCILQKECGKLEGTKIFFSNGFKFTIGQTLKKKDTKESSHFLFFFFTHFSLFVSSFWKYPKWSCLSSAYGILALFQTCSLVTQGASACQHSKSMQKWMIKKWTFFFYFSESMCDVNVFIVISGNSPWVAFSTIESGRHL